jgi:hypothetical protein
MSQARCPVCNQENHCEVAPDGQSGYCRRKKKSWKKKLLTASELKDLRPGPIQHQELPRLLLDVIRWEYSVVGHYIHPTLEQWELSLMRERNIVGEVGFFHRLSFAFIDYHRRRGLPLRSKKEEKSLISSFIVLGSNFGEIEDDDLTTLRQCWESPAGFHEDVERVKRLAATSRDLSVPWSPPESVAGWPD